LRHASRSSHIAERCGEQPRIPVFDGQADVVGDGLVVVQVLGRIELGQLG
jgi:hypothetical protein